MHYSIVLYNLHYFSFQSLISQIGEADWAAMSEKERQARIMKLRLQERKLRQEGKIDEATALLTQGIKNQEGMLGLLINCGICRCVGVRVREVLSDCV